MADEKEAGIVETIRELQAREPFDPFTIVTTSGDKYRVEVAANLVFGKTYFFYCYPGQDRVAYIRLNQMRSNSPWEAIRPGSAGSRRRGHLRKSVC